MTTIKTKPTTKAPTKAKPVTTTKAPTKGKPATTTKSSTTTGPRVVLIGDSLSSYAKQTMDKYCRAGMSTNRGIGGATALQMLTQDKNSKYYVPKAIKDKSGSCYEYVFVSLGGNDQMSTGCKETGVATVKSRITEVLKQINTLCPSSQIIMTGYPTPTKDFSDCKNFPITSAGTRKILNAPVQAACEDAEKCTYHDATDRFGSTDLKPSSGKYHVDTVHLNEDGYCRLWSTDLFKSAFKCTSTMKCKDDSVASTTKAATKPPTKPAMTTKPPTKAKPATTTKSSTTTGPRVVLIGDSLSSYAKQTMDKYCRAGMSTNRGAG